MSESITSRDNPKIKAAIRVREMREPGLIFIEGMRLAEEAIKSGLNIRETFFTEKFSQSERGAELLKLTKDPIEVSEKLFTSIADTKQSQGIILIAEGPKNGREQIELSNKHLLLLLHEINNPANLGAILRTAEAAGVVGVILTKTSADAFSPKALRGSMGASLRLPIWVDVEFQEAIEWAKANGIKTTASDISGNKNYTDTDWDRPKLLIFGSEAHGLSAEELALIDEAIMIPMENNVESLNIGVAAGIILFEAKKQRHK